LILSWYVELERDVEESLNQFNFMDGIFFETKSSVFRFLIQGGIGILKVHINRDRMKDGRSIPLEYR